MLTNIALVVLAVVVIAIAVVLGLAAARPDTFRVQRSATIAAPPEKIFPHIVDFHNWPAWSPYEHKDPAMKKTYSGAPSGKGAVYDWTGDKNVGEGRITITDASPPSRLTLDLDMFKPFAAHNMVEFTLQPQGGATLVTWAMNGQVPFFAKVLHLFFDMDKMVGGDFEVGLTKLKAVAEK